MIPVLLLLGLLPARAAGGPCVPCLQGAPGQSCGPCLKLLEAEDLSFLSGHPLSAKARGMDDGLLTKLCKRIRNGEVDAISIGFRLALFLDEKPNEKVVGALSDSVLKNTQGFLACLQSMMDFSKKENVAGPLKEGYWNAFAENNSGYGNRSEELRAVRKRKEAVRKADNPSTREAQTYILELFEEKARRLTTGT